MWLVPPLLLSIELNLFHSPSGPPDLRPWARRRFRSRIPSDDACLMFIDQIDLNYWFIRFISWLSDPSGTDLTVVFSSSSPPPPPPPSRFKPIVNKQLHSSYFSIATHIKYRFRKLMTRTIQWWPRDDTDKDTHKDKYEDKDKDIQEESLPIYISLRILSSNEYI